MAEHTYALVPHDEHGERDGEQPTDGPASNRSHSKRHEPRSRLYTLSPLSVAVLLLVVCVAAASGAVSLCLLVARLAGLRQLDPATFASYFRPSDSSSLAQLYSFNASLPPLLSINRPFPPRFPFPVSANTARLSSFYSLVRSGVGVVVGVVGGSVSSGHTLSGSTLQQRQELMYGARLVQWLNKYYPVRSNSSYRHLERHVLWNAAKPASDSRWSSHCLETQFQELQRMERFAQEGNEHWVTRRQQEARQRQQQTEDELAFLSPSSTAFYMPDLLLVEFSANDVDQDQPSERRVGQYDSAPSADSTVDSFSDPAHGRPSNGSRGSSPMDGWSAPAMERLVRSVLGRADFPTSLVLLSHTFHAWGNGPGSNYDASFHNNQQRHAAIAHWYDVPLVSVRDRMWWPRVSLLAATGPGQGYDWWELDTHYRTRASDNSNIGSVLNGQWENIRDTMYADPVHLSARGHQVVACLLVDELRLFVEVYRNSDEREPRTSERFPRHLPLPALNVQQAADSFFSATDPSAVTPLPVMLYSENAAWLAASLSRSIACRRRFVAYDPIPGAQTEVDFKVTSPLPAGWTRDNDEGKWGYVFNCPAGSCNPASIFTVCLEPAVQHRVEILTTVSGTHPVGTASVTATCEVAGTGATSTQLQPSLFRSEPVLVNTTSATRATVTALVDLSLVPAPSQAPCRYSQLHFTVIDSLPFRFIGYLVV